ncbi:MAG TPA: serine acetyltransferase [Verrucomicrobiota bacterium]|nr:serine acetyltransferase [Verrucomicrobiales bacterium]HRI16250.1 serine acetyltransferase [Verrucomicrobiota bacterium]
MTYPITDLTQALLASYRRHGGINHLDGVNLPSRAGVSEITNDLLRLIFPGFFDDRVVHSSELQVETAQRVDAIAGRLEDEIYKSLRCFDCPDGGGQDVRTRAHDLTCEFLRQLPGVRERLQTDVEAAFQGDPAARNREEVIVAYPFIEAIAVHRLAHELYQRDVPLLPRIMSEWAHSRTGMDIHPGARIGTYFFVDHCTGTVIGETTEIGNHVKLYQGVGLVARSLAAGQALRGQKRHPTLEDRVTIYANATIVGGDTVIGAGSTIGANVFLMQSLPPESLVLFEDGKAKIVSKRDRTGGTDFQI